MPTFQGLVSEEQVLALIEYVKSLKRPQAGQGQGSQAPQPGGSPPAGTPKK